MKIYSLFFGFLSTRSRVERCLGLKVFDDSRRDQALPNERNPFKMQRHNYKIHTIGETHVRRQAGNRLLIQSCVYRTHFHQNSKTNSRPAMSTGYCFVRREETTGQNTRWIDERHNFRLATSTRGRGQSEEFPFICKSPYARVSQRSRPAGRSASWAGGRARKSASTSWRRE